MLDSGPGSLPIPVEAIMNSPSNPQINVASFPLMLVLIPSSPPDLNCRIYRKRVMQLIQGRPHLAEWE